MVNVHNDDNHEHVQPFDEVVFVQQPWRSVTPNYNLPKIDASPPITTFVGFQNQPLHTNIHLVPANLEMEQLHLFNGLEQLRHVDWRPSNQLVFIPHIEPVEPKVTSTVVRQGVIYPQGTQRARLVVGPSERSQVPHHRPVLRGNQGVEIITCSYCYQKGHMFSRCPFVDDKLKQLLRVEVTNVHQPILPTITIVIPNMFILGTQAMNLNIVHIMVPINY